MKTIYKALCGGWLVLSTLSISNLNAQTNFDFPTQSYNANQNGCSNFSFTTNYKVTGIRVTNYGDYGFNYSLLFEFTNTFTGTPPNNDFWNYHLHTTLKYNNIITNQEVTDVRSATIQGQPLSTQTGSGVTNNAYYGGLGAGAALGITANGDYTNASIIQHFNPIAVRLQFNMDCMGNNNNQTTIEGVATNPVPIDLVDFNALSSLNSVQLKWTGLNEYSNSHFIVQRKNGEAEWIDIANIPSLASGSNVMANNTYQFVDKTPLDGKNFYRLKIVSIDNTIQYSEIIFVTFIKNDNIVSLYPNPSNGILNIKNARDASFLLMDILGKQVHQQILSADNISTLDLHHLPKGVYYYHINKNGVKTVGKIVFNKY